MDGALRAADACQWFSFQISREKWTARFWVEHEVVLLFYFLLKVCIFGGAGVVGPIKREVQ